MANGTECGIWMLVMARLLWGVCCATVRPARSVDCVGGPCQSSLATRRVAAFAMSCGSRRSGGRRLAALAPFDVVGSVEGDEHQATRLAPASELMWHVVPHHGKSAGPKLSRRVVGISARTLPLTMINCSSAVWECHGTTHPLGALRTQVDGPVFASPTSSAEDKHFTSSSGLN
jgi:hypothetical protein